MGDTSGELRGSRRRPSGNQPSPRVTVTNEMLADRGEAPVACWQGCGPRQSFPAAPRGPRGGGLGPLVWPGGPGQHSRHWPRSAGAWRDRSCGSTGSAGRSCPFGWYKASPWLKTLPRINVNEKKYLRITVLTQDLNPNYTLNPAARSNQANWKTSRRSEQTLHRRRPP